MADTDSPQTQPGDELVPDWSDVPEDDTREADADPHETGGQ